MADVISLQERMPRAPRKSVKLPDDAKILLFTGVQHEPMDDKAVRVFLNDAGEHVKH